MSKTTDHVIERMNEQLEELLGPKPEARLSRMSGWMPKKNKKCLNCHDMELMLDEQCPDCGRQAYNMIQSHGGGIIKKIN